MSAYSFIYPPTITWGPAFQRPQQLMRAFADLGHTAVFCDTSAKDDSYREAAPGLFIAGSWEEVLRRRFSDPVLWISYPRHWRLISSFPGNPYLVFDFLDEPVDEFKHWLRGYDEMIKMSHLVFACSDRLFNLAQDAHPRVFMARNAGEYEKFAPVAAGTVAAHPDLAEKGPVLGFIGAVESWVDLALIRDIARARPDWTIAMIGKVSTSVAPLRSRPNVLFLGSKPYEQLPGYMASFDVALVPFQVRDMTHAANPIKMYEYLAAGLPVVATDIAECRGHEPLVYTASDARDFIRAVERAIPERRDENMVQKRLEFARQNTWKSRARDIITALDAHRDTARRPRMSLQQPRKKSRIRVHR